MFKPTIRSTALAMLILLAPMGALAQTSPSSAAATDTQFLKPAELDQLVAPICTLSRSATVRSPDGLGLPA